MIKYQTMTLVEAVEILSSIADLDLNPSLGVMQKNERDGNATFKTLEWLNEKEREEGLVQVRDAFASTLNFLQDFYRDEYKAIHDEKTADRIKTVMVLVGEAGKKIDQYSKQLGQKAYHSVSEMKEYRSLQHFFEQNISRTINEGTIGKWLLEITRNAWSKEGSEKLRGPYVQEMSHVFVDLDSVKNDTEYELFSLRKDDGTRFFSPRIVRNIKLISDFGDIFNKTKKADLLADLGIWKDRYLQQTAKNMLKQSRAVIDVFFKEAFPHRENSLVAVLSHALVALLFASNPKNLMSNVIKKSCGDYFADFLMYFRETLNHREYQKWVIYPPRSEHKIGNAIIKTGEALSYALYDHKEVLETMQPLVRQLLDEGKKEISSDHDCKNPQLWNRLAGDWQALNKVIKTHPNGPLNKVIQSIVEGHYNSFEPLSSANIPYRIFTLYYPNKHLSILRLPCPTMQEGLSKAEIIPEFKSFLRKDEPHLMVVMQDRTSWREGARAFALENLKKNGEDKCHVLTLPTETDFYHQNGIYSDENLHVGSWENFSNTLLDQAGDLSAGYYFDVNMEEHLEAFIPKMMECVHTLFFRNSKQLSRDERRSFIDIFYLFVTLKAINLSNPGSLSFTCKDGIDLGNMFSMFVWSFFILLEKDEVSNETILQLEAYLFGPALFARERTPLSQPFQRFIHSLRHLEKIRAEYGTVTYQSLVKECLRLIYDDDTAEIKVI